MADLTYGDLLAAFAQARADEPVEVRGKNGARYRIVSAGIELDLGPHLKPDDITLPGPQPDDDQAGHQSRREPLLALRREVELCDGNCTAHRAQTSDRRTAWIAVERV